MCINNLGLYKFLFFFCLNTTSGCFLFFVFLFFFINLYLCFETAFKCLCFRIASTFPFVDLFFSFFIFLHCLSFFCTKSWAMVPASFAVGSGPGTFVVVFC